MPFLWAIPIAEDGRFTLSPLDKNEVTGINIGIEGIKVDEDVDAVDEHSNWFVVVDASDWKSFSNDQSLTEPNVIFPFNAESLDESLLIPNPSNAAAIDEGTFSKWWLSPFEVISIVCVVELDAKDELIAEDSNLQADKGDSVVIEAKDKISLFAKCKVLGEDTVADAKFAEPNTVGVFICR